MGKAAEETSTRKSGVKEPNVTSGQSIRPDSKSHENKNLAKKMELEQPDIFASAEGFKFDEPLIMMANAKAGGNLIDLQLPTTWGPASESRQEDDILCFEDCGFDSMNLEVAAHDSFIDSLTFNAPAERPLIRDLLRDGSGKELADSRASEASFSNVSKDRSVGLASGSMEPEGGGASSSLAEAKMKEMIPGSCLVDLGRLTDSKARDSSRQKKGKVKMNKMWLKLRAFLLFRRILKILNKNN